MKTRHGSEILKLYDSSALKLTELKISKVLLALSTKMLTKILKTRKADFSGPQLSQVASTNKINSIWHVRTCRIEFITRINLFPNVSVRFLWYVSAKQPTAKNTATNHTSDLATPPTSPPILPLPPPCPHRRRRRPCCHRPCCCHCPCLLSSPLLPSSSMLSALTLSSSLPVVLTVLAGHPCRRRRCPHCRCPCCCRCPHPLLLPSSPVVLIVLTLSSSAAFG